MFWRSKQFVAAAITLLTVVVVLVIFVGPRVGTSLSHRQVYTLQMSHVPQTLQKAVSVAISPATQLQIIRIQDDAALQFRSKDPQSGITLAGFAIHPDKAAIDLYLSPTLSKDKMDSYANIVLFTALEVLQQGTTGDLDYIKAGQQGFADWQKIADWPERYLIHVTQ